MIHMSVWKSSRNLRINVNIKSSEIANASANNIILKRNLLIAKLSRLCLDSEEMTNASPRLLIDLNNKKKSKIKNTN